MVGRLIQIYRTIQNIGVRELAQEIGISASSLSRIERGGNMDGQSMILLINWLFKQKESQKVAEAVQEEACDL